MNDRFQHGYALIVGVGRCVYEPWSLPVTVNDARAIREALLDPLLCAYPEENFICLTDETATSQKILDSLSWLNDQCVSDQEATVVVYYSGHGWVSKSTGEFFLIPHNVAPHDIAGSALAAADFQKALRAIEARRLLVFIDSCHAEGMAEAKDIESALVQLPPDYGKSAAPEALIAQLKQGEGRAVFTSARGKQESHWRTDNTMSIYTHHLLEAFDGAGSDAGDTEVRVSHLMTHLARTVPESAWQQRHAEQVPFFDLASEDFPVALLRGGKGLPAGGWRPEETLVKGTAKTNQATADHVSAVAQDHSTAVASRGVNVGGSVAGSIVTGDNNIVADHGATVGVSGAELEKLFEPILSAVSAAPQAQQTEALQMARDLQEEATKGEEADDGRMASLIDGLVKLVPGAAAAVAGAFGSPILAGIAGPVTQWVLQSIHV